MTETVQKAPTQTSLEILREIYPHLSNERLVEVKERIDAYLSIVERVMKRIKGDPDAQAKYEALKAHHRSLTEPGNLDNLKIVEY